MIHAVILKVAARCNLNCGYCYVYNHEDKGFRQRPPFIADDVFDHAMRAVAAYCDRRQGHQMSITFHGGEPTLIGPGRFDQLAMRAKELLGERLKGLSMQTNASLINKAWLTVLCRHRVQVGVSLDGPQAIHDMHRVDHLGRGSYEHTVAGLAKLQQAGLDPGLLCVVNPASSGLDVYRHFRSLGLPRMDFLLPDATHDSRARLYGHLGPTPVADYLIPIFDEWFDEDDPGIRIRLFTDLLRLLMGGLPDSDAFGSTPMSYVVVETDGSIEALDALRVCEDGIARSGLNVRSSNFDDLSVGRPLVYHALHEGFPLCDTCRRCPERETCGGGYLPHRFARANGFDNPSVWCADILALLTHIRARLDQAARESRTAMAVCG